MFSGFTLIGRSCGLVSISADPSRFCSSAAECNQRCCSTPPPPPDNPSLLPCTQFSCRAVNMSTNTSAAGTQCDKSKPTQCATLCCLASTPDVELYNCATFDCAIRSRAQQSRNWDTPCNTTSECDALCCEPTFSTCAAYDCTSASLLQRRTDASLICGSALDCNQRCCQPPPVIPTPLACPAFNCRSLNMTANPDSSGLQCDKNSPSECGSICCKAPGPDTELYNCATFDCTARALIQV
jgi:hypothetical protein